jgi:hypothetical protein
LNEKDRQGAIADFNLAFNVWPHPTNPAVGPLEDLYRETKDQQALATLKERVETLKQFRP